MPDREMPERQTDEGDPIAHEHTVVRIRGVWEERGGLFEITRRVCLECAHVVEEELVGLPERRRVPRLSA